MFGGGKKLEVSRCNIVDLSGIEYFTALTKLDCSGNLLISLDVTQNPALTYLNCENNNFRNSSSIIGVDTSRKRFYR